MDNEVRLLHDNGEDAGPAVQILAPVLTSVGEAAAIISGHDFIAKCEADNMLAFNDFVREVLDTTVGVEVERMKRLLRRTIPALERAHAMTPGGPKKSSTLALLRDVREAVGET